MDANDLKEGACYFLLLFYPSENEIPMIKTYIYLGKNIFGRESSEDEWYFQYPRSYLEGSSDLGEGFLASEERLSSIYDLKGLIERLSKIKGCKP